MKIKVSVVIPTIESGKFIQSNMKSLEGFLIKSKFILDYEIIIAAQTSKDDTFQKIKDLKSSKIKPIFLRKRGKGIGLTAGFKHAKYNWVLMMDDDLPYPFESVEKLFSYTNENDIVIASRHVEKIKHQIPLIRKVASSVYRGIVKLLMNIPQKDIQSGMKLIKKELFEKTAYPKEQGYVWDTEALFLANKKRMRIVEVPVKCTHKPNKLVVYKTAIPMFLGVLRVRIRYLF